MSGGQAGVDDVTMWRRRTRRNACGRSLGGAFPALVLVLACLLYMGIYADVADGYIDAYQQLENYGFPIGLLPHTVTGYELAENGKFAVYLEGKCEIDIPSAFPVVYSNKIAGKLSYGSLKDLSGIQVRIYKWVWLSINAITVQDDDLRFEVGIISASYPIHPNFDENPECLNGLNSEEEALLYLDE